MSKDVIVMALIWVTASIAVILFIPRGRWAEAIFVYMLSNSLTWINALIHLQYGLISFPVREFPKATDLSSTLDYFGYPLVIVFYFLYEPNKNWSIRLLYLSAWITCLVLFDLTLVKFTNLVKYQVYHWYWTWIDFFVVFFIIRMISKWFFRREPHVI